MKLHRRTVTAVLLTALIAIPTLGARASQGGAPVEWNRIPCFSGAITGMEWVTDPQLGRALRVTGHVACVQAKGTPTAHFAFARYLPGAPVGTTGDRFLPYATQGTATPFEITRQPPQEGPPRGICLVTDTAVRLACFVLSATDPPQPIGTNHPLVVKDVIAGGERGDGGTLCGTCF